MSQRQRQERSQNNKKFILKLREPDTKIFEKLL